MDIGTAFLPNFLLQLVVYLPVLIVLLAGLVMAIIRWKKHPRASLLMMIAAVLAGLAVILNAGVNSFPLNLYYLQGMITAATKDIIANILSLIISLLTAGSWVLVLIAVFGKRKPKAEAE